MRAAGFLTALIFSAALAGCASTTDGDARADYKALLADCTGRGGELKPIPGATNANEASNYVCEFKGSGPR